MSCAQAQWVGSNPIYRVLKLQLHKPTMVIGHSLCMCAQHVDSTNPGQSNLVFRSKPIPEAEMSNRLIAKMSALNIRTLNIHKVVNPIIVIVIVISRFLKRYLKAK